MDYIIAFMMAGALMIGCIFSGFLLTTIFFSRVRLWQNSSPARKIVILSSVIAATVITVWRFDDVWDLSAFFLGLGILFGIFTIAYSNR